jgi:peptidoglycan/LPS O-acetylase OafA/YrhL
MTLVSGARPAADRTRTPVDAPGGGRRADLQGLRALAVAAVVANHLWPQIVPGGYVGVDIFFVISGFLITSHLLRESERTGRISLAAFWARRARRLLPASLLVIAASLVATYVLAPENMWQQYFRDFGAGALYVLNWVLAADSVDYFAASNEPSPIQHYWSLSAEEQFYLVWPVVIIAASLIARRWTRVGRLPGIGVALTLVTLASFVTSIVFTLTDPLPAYFVTTTRAWEFGAGGLLAVGLAANPALAVAWAERARSAVAWLGLIALVASLWVFDPDTSFPGWRAALPVTAAVAVIWAGSAGSPRWSPDIVVRARPIQWLGDISYSVYLWHWPLIVFVPFALHGALTDLQRIAIVAATLMLAALTKALVEDPVRQARALTSRRPRVTFAAVAVASGLVGLAALSGWTGMQNRIDDSIQQTRELVGTQPSCFGAAAAAVGISACDNPALDGVLVPDRAAGQSDAAIDPQLGCRVDSTSARVKRCTLVDGAPGALRVALVGDSHAEHWAPALAAIARTHDWRLDTFLKGGCPFSTVMHADDRDGGTCEHWNAEVLDRLADSGYDLIVTSQASGREYTAREGESSYAAAARGMAEQWSAARKAAGAVVMVIRDGPRLPFNVSRCLSTLDDPARQSDECSAPESEALLPDPQVEAARRAKVPLIDLTRFFCQDGVCPGVIGSVIVYRDNAHLGGTYSTTLAPYLDQAISGNLPEPGP